MYFRPHVHAPIITIVTVESETYFPLPMKSFESVTPITLGIKTLRTAGPPTAWYDRKHSAEYQDSPWI